MASIIHRFARADVPFYCYNYRVEESDLTAYVVGRLARAENLNDIIFELCEKTGWSWPQAEAFVLQVQESHQGEVAERQFPILFILAAGTYLAGIGLMAYSLHSVFDVVKLLKRMEIPALDVFSVLMIAFNTAVGPIVLFATGLAMVLGSLIGMRDVWKSMLARD